MALGLRENIGQFALLVLVNGFVGAMIGLERTLLPLVARDRFAVATSFAILSFIAAFGFAKALSNYVSGRLSNRYGRRQLLIAGWMLALPVPLIFWYAPHWYYILWANVLLGVHQGFAWSSTVVMKIDLVGEKRRGVAMGLNEFAGYVAVALAAFGSAWAVQFAAPLQVMTVGGGLIATTGLLLTVFFVRDTRHHAALEATISCRPRLASVFWDTTLNNRNLSAVTQAGLVNNLNDGLVWGLLPLLMKAQGYSLSAIGLAAALYPLVWGVVQIGTGAWSDRFSKREFLVAGMGTQAVGILGFLMAASLATWLLCSFLLGIGTAMVYPVFLSVVADNTHPVQRAESIGVFRLWRDLGYVIGAVLTGLVSDWWGMGFAIGFVGVLTGLSGLVVLLRMRDLASCEGKSTPSLWRHLFKQPKPE
jgi:MFS family permease